MRIATLSRQSSAPKRSLTSSLQGFGSDFELLAENRGKREQAYGRGPSRHHTAEIHDGTGSKPEAVVTKLAAVRAGGHEGCGPWHE